MRVTVDMQLLCGHRGPYMPAGKREEMMQKAGMTKYMYDSSVGNKVFYVERKPEDALIYGVRWIKLDEQD